MAIVTQDDLKHEIVLDRNMPILRVYKKVYGPTATLDFCHLFWGIAALPLLAFATVILSPIIAVIFALVMGKEALEDRASAKRIARMNEPMPPPKPAKPEKEHTRAYRALDWFAMKASAGIMRVRDWGHRHHRALYRVGMAFLVGVNAIGFGFLLWAGASAAVGALAALDAQTWADLAMYGGISLGAMAAFIGAVILGYRRDVHKEIAYVATRPAIGGWAVFKMGYRAVKTNTCPRITLMKEDE